MVGRLVLLCVASLSLLAAICTPAGASVTRSGTLQATVLDDFQSGHSETRYRLRSGEQELAVRPTELDAEPGDRVAATGQFRGDRLVGTVQATNGDAQAQTISPGPRKTAVVLSTFSGEPPEPWSLAESRSEVFTATNSVSAFYKEESYGEISLTGKLRPDGDVFGWYSVNTPTAGCPYETWRAAAAQAAADAGVDLSGYQHVIYEFPHQSSCGTVLGIAGLNSDWVVINGNFFGTRRQTTIHELGHNLGLLHAGSWTCTANGERVQISDTCSTGEYGDPFDAMGNIAMRHNNGWSLAKLGFLSPENVETVEASGTYALHSALHPTTEPTVLRVPRTETVGGYVTSWYYLELRQTGGVFENVSDASTGGVSIRATAEGASPETLLLDANPATATFQDAPLGVGETFYGGPVKFKTVSAGGGLATVAVELDEEPPAKPDELRAAVDADGVHLSWSGSDNVAVTEYFVFRDGELVSSVGTPDFLDIRPPAGEHDYVVVAEDESKNQSDPSDPLTVAVPVVSGPTCSNDECKLAFRYSGAPTTWTVPPGVSDAFLTVEGAGGGGGAGGPERGAGVGARIWATLEPLTRGGVAEISIGGQGKRYSAGGSGGFNGGGSGALGGGGGGYTAVSLGSTLQVLAGGGGGGGLDGVNGTLLPSGGRGGAGGEQGSAGTSGAQTVALGATLRGGAGGGRGGTGGIAGAGGQILNSTSCPGGAQTGAPGAAGGSFAGGGGVVSAGGGGGGGYVGGGQGGGGAGDACGALAGSGGGGGGSSFVAPGRLNGFDTAGGGDGWLSIGYDNPIGLASHSYATEPDQALTVPAASGVLSAASVPNEDPLAASVVSEPVHGNLSLSDDGAFEYLPAPGYAGSDSFAYRAEDSAGSYATAPVQLTVGQPATEPEPREEGELPGDGGPGNGGGSGNPPAPGPVAEPPPPAPALPAIEVDASARVVGGAARIRLTCSGGRPGGSCRGVLSLAGGSPARVRYALQSGEARRIAVQLSPATLRRLRRAPDGILDVWVTATEAAGDGARRTVALHLHTRHSGRSPVRKRGSSGE